MSFFLKNSGKGENERIHQENSSRNEEKKGLIQSKPLLIQNTKKFSKRSFGKELQNLKPLTEENHLLFRKRKRNKETDNIFLKNLKKDNNLNNLNTIGTTMITKKKKISSFNISHIAQQGHKSKIKEDDDENNIGDSMDENKNPNEDLTTQITTISTNQLYIEAKNEYPNFCYQNEQPKITWNDNITNIDEGVGKKTIFMNSKNKTNDESVINNSNNKILELQNAKEYLDEIYIYLKGIENQNLPLGTYLANVQTDINEKMRIILFNWIIEVHYKFHLVPETLYLCINIIDRYLSKKNINRKILQLLGVASLYIACKYEEIYAPSSKDLIFMTDNAYSKEEFLKMESDILDVINYDMTYPTSLNFLEIFRYYLDLDEINFFRCSYLNEITLLNYNFCSFNPSLVACACLYLNLKSNILCNKGYNEDKLFHVTGYKKDEIQNCLGKLVDAVKKINEAGNRFTAIKKKYALDKFRNVSNESYIIEDE